MSWMSSFGLLNCTWVRCLKNTPISCGPDIRIKVWFEWQYNHISWRLKPQNIIPPTDNLAVGVHSVSIYLCLIWQVWLLKLQPKLLSWHAKNSPATAHYLKDGKKRQCYWTIQTSASALVYLVHPVKNKRQKFITLRKLKWTGNTVVQGTSECSPLPQQYFKASNHICKFLPFPTLSSALSNKFSPSDLMRFTLKEWFNVQQVPSVYPQRHLQLAVHFQNATESSCEINLAIHILNWQWNNVL